MSAPKKTIVWISSYPKSGNTWVRFLACNLVFGPIDSAETLGHLAPDLHELRGAAIPEDRLVLMKTHFPYSAALPLVDRTAAAIHVLRDPADVMVSNFHYAQRSGTASGEDASAFDRYVDDYIAARGDPRWIKLGMGSWEGNVRSWMEPGIGFPVLQVRYEDLLSDASRMAGSLCRFLGLTRSPAEIAGAVAAASFERLREIEEADIRARRVGIFYKPYLQETIGAGVRFMRAGRSGAAAGVLSEDQCRRFAAAFGALRHQLGYTRHMTPDIQHYSRLMNS